MGHRFLSFFIIIIFLLGFGNTQQHQLDLEKAIRVVENKNESVSLRAGAVDKLIKLSARTATPRLMKVLNEHQSYADVLTFRILVFLQDFPTTEAIPSLMKYEESARKKNIQMADKISTAFCSALRECQKQKKKKS